MVDVVGDDGAAAGDLVADELRRDVVGDARAEALAVADVVKRHFAAEIFTGGDVLHLGRYDAAPGIVHLADVPARLRAQRTADDIGEGLDAAGAVGAELAVVLGPRRAGVVGFDIATADDPVAAELG